MSLHDVYVVHASDRFAGEIREFLERLGWGTVAFPTAFDCMLAIPTGRPDLVICDLDDAEGATLAGRLLYGNFDVPCLSLTVGEGAGYDAVSRTSQLPNGFWSVLPNPDRRRLHEAIVDALLSRLRVRPRELSRFDDDMPPALDEDFRALFWRQNCSDLVLDPELRVLAVSAPYARDVGRKAEDLLGRTLFELFPDNPEDSEASGAANLGHSLSRAGQLRVADAMPLQRYDVRADGGTGPFEERWWYPVNYPVCARTSLGVELDYLVHRVADVTRFVKLRRTLDSAVAVAA